eukprot:TRINITY_DN9796_c0_g1_i7.p1 TRINITY_DN9796_c0_g1~~TRINITY_DN9796_c0_g1_i7.p1  ORF type:complete len:239 (+),score=45.12 TRINITY_DN9796_c0_g1_i7:570-1286(+)
MHPIPRMHPDGNSAFSVLVEEEMSRLNAEASNYKSRSESWLNPWQFLCVLKLIISKNSNEALKFYTMVLLGAICFLRSEEIINMRLKDVRLDLSSFSFGSEGNFVVNWLTIAIQGKADATERFIQIYPNHVFKFLCPVNALLWYLNSFQSILSSSAENQRLFPGTDYETFQECFKKALKGLNSLSGRLSTHTIRRTSFLLATFQNLEYSEMLQARMKYVEWCEWITGLRVNSDLLKLS